MKRYFMRKRRKVVGSLYLSDIVARTGISPKKIMLIRHSVNDKDFKKCMEAGMVKEYTRHQRANFAKGAEYWMVFLSGKSTTAKFYACYKVNGEGVKANAEMCAEGFPFPEWYEKEEEYLYPLEEVDIMSDLKNRLVIEWGKAATAWYQWGTNEKEVLSIQMSEKKVFNGFDTLRLSFDELEEIVNDSTLYENWHTAMSSVYAIYLIADKVDGQLYVGSAYSADGLLGRWSVYVKTKHGGNVLMRKKLEEYPERYHDFQFSVLQILPKTLTNDEVIETESLWKSKLLSKEFGMNDN